MAALDRISYVQVTIVHLSKLIFANVIYFKYVKHYTLNHVLYWNKVFKHDNGFKADKALTGILSPLSRYPFS